MSSLGEWAVSTWQSFVSWAEWAIGVAWDWMCMYWKQLVGAILLVGFGVAGVAYVKKRGKLVPEVPPQPGPVIQPEPSVIPDQISEFSISDSNTDRHSSNLSQFSDDNID